VTGTSMRLEGKRALITGAASGIGRATALRFGAEGARVAVTDLDGDGAEEVAALIRDRTGDAIALTLDVRDEGGWEVAMAAVLDRWGGLEVLVANAGVSFAAAIPEMTLEEWRHVLAVNLDGVFLGTKHGIRAMAAGGGGGSVVIVASASGIKASAGASAYCAGKAGALHFARAAALECAGEGIRVNAVLPGAVATPMWTGMPFFQGLVDEHGEEGAWKALAAGNPMGRFAEPDEVAAAILFLASDEAGYITGAELTVDGGYTA
jgi:3(or 17)beta-hydroxysteroid dehydrogenase